MINAICWYILEKFVAPPIALLNKFHLFVLKKLENALEKIDKQ